jgi:hypothetical protein
MHSFNSRAGRRPLALALGALATAAVLAACADDPTSPLRSASLDPNATTLADPFTVTNLNDNGIGSLRWVLSYADSGQTIRFDPALAGKTIVLDSAIKMYLEDVTIEGPKDRGITISGGGRTRVLETWGAGPYMLRNLAITGGSHASSPAMLGGGVDVVFENSSIYGNASTGDNGGTSALGLSRVTLINSTVSGNSAVRPTASSAVYATSKLVIINSTVAHNASGGISPSTALVLRNVILSNNEGRNCAGTNITREGTNLSDDDTCGGPTEMVIADPKLGPFGDNGGPTPTHAIAAGSPAISVGTSCSVAVDQRYVPRDAQCDLGAYEFTDPTSVTVTIDPSVPVSQSNGWALVSGTVTCSRAETFNIAVQLVQPQKTGKTATTVDAANIVPVECGTIPRPWSASMVLTSGAFQNGSAAASAQTVNTQPWVTPASATSAVKLYWARK